MKATVSFLSKNKFIILVILSALSTACSFNVTDGKDNKYLVLPIGLDIQSMHTTPSDGRRIIDFSELQAGDILLSREISITSYGVRAFTTSSVSHASLYLGDKRVAEAIRSGVQIVDLQDAADHSLMIAAYRYPDLTSVQRVKIREFAQLQEGKKYNFKGIILMVPYSLTRQVCELPPLNEKIRNRCLQHLASFQISSFGSSDSAFFCSQLVLEAYNYAGRPITAADPIWVSPDDLMHMREGDIKSISSHKELIYVGHLKL